MTKPEFEKIVGNALEALPKTEAKTIGLYVKAWLINNLIFIHDEKNPNRTKRYRVLTRDECKKEYGINFYIPSVNELDTF